MADIPGNSTTDATITVGGTFEGDLEVVADHDWYQLQLTAGQQVTIVLTGITLEDPYLRIRDSAGNIIFENDDISSGEIRDSRVSFTAPSTGTYYVDVGAWNEGYIGTYQLSVEPYTPPPEWSIEQVGEFLASGYWNGDSHPFDVSHGGSITVNITALTPAGQILALTALDYWSDVIGVTFVQVTSGSQITFDDDQEGAFADSIWAKGVTTSSHINIDVNWLFDYGTQIGGYAFQTYIHEIGHALGLGHAGYYNGIASYFDDALFSNDGWPTTIMSYFDQSDSDYFRDLSFSFAFIGTPMIGDVAAMQLLYGLSTTTRTGNTTYGFNSNAGRDVFNASLYPDVAYTIFDSGGIDTIDYSGSSALQTINLTGGAFSSVGGLTGNVAIALGTLIENAIGGSGADVLLGNSANNVLTGGLGQDALHGFDGNDRLIGGEGNDLLEGGAGEDVLDGGNGTDTLTGEGGCDSFQGNASALNGDTITDITSEDRIVITDANLSSFSFSLSGSTLTYSGGSLTLSGGVSGTLTAADAPGGGVQLTLSAQLLPPPPPLPTIWAKLLLTETGQDFDIGGNVMVIGTTDGGEEVRVLRGDILLDASFNVGGDTVVLPGNAASYTAVLSGSFVTISGGDISIAIPVGVNGLTVEFADAERSLRFDPGTGQVLLGTQAVTGTSAAVTAAITPFTSDGPDTRPASMAKLLLTEPGQDIDIGGNVTIVGTTGAGEVMTIIGGTIMLDASFNVGGDTVELPDVASSYTAILSGSFVTISGGDLSISIPVGIAGLSVEFADETRSLRFDTGSGQVMLGDQVVSAGGGPLAAAPLSADKDGGTQYGLSLEDLVAPAELTFAPELAWAPKAEHAPTSEVQRFEFSETFSIG